MSSLLLGEVRLPAGGLPLLMRLEFYQLDERNWGGCYVFVMLHAAEARAL
jgi:hypothetical protein